MSWLRNAWNSVIRWFRGDGPVAGRLGPRGERLAAARLEAAGMRIVGRGVRYPCGELDLVALDDDVVVFVEVKTRRSGRRGAPSQAVDRKKQARMTRAALVYLKSQRLLQSRARFDVVSIVWPPGDGEPEVAHLRSAFAARDFDGMFS